MLLKVMIQMWLVHGQICNLAKSLLESVKSQVEAAEIANEGITLEYESGLSGRSTLDVIQSSSILLNSEISLANFERNYLLAQFNLLRSVGLLKN